MNETFQVQNLKCGGCANTIKKNLSQLNGIDNITVDHEKGEIQLERNQNTISRETISETLKSLGYPEISDKNNLLTQIKSYSSCVIGKMDL